MLEEHEEDIEEWFFHHQGNNKNADTSHSSSLENYLCREGRVLKTKTDRMCLDELEGKSKKKKPKRIKGDQDITKEDDIQHAEL